MATPLPPVHLEWVAPADCPSRDDVLDAIGRVLGGRDVSGVVDARVVVLQGEPEFRAEVTVSASGTTSTRPLVGESCRAVADAAALIVALAASPDASPPPPEPASVGAAAAPAKAEDTPVPQHRRPFFVQGSFVVDSSMLPRADFGGELAVGWRPSHLELEMDGTFLGSERASLASRPSQGADVWLAQVGARACYAIFDSAMDLGPCVGAGVEWLAAQGFGSAPDKPSDATAFLGVGRLGGRATFQVSSRLVLRLTGEAVVPSARPAYEIGGAGQVLQAGGASFRAAAGAEVHF